MKNSALNYSPSKSREKVLQTLYEMEIGGKELNEILIKNSSKKSNSFYLQMLNGVVEDKERIDQILTKYIDRPKEKLDPIERNALRIAIYEFLNKKIDKAVAINEAIRISKKYGTSDGYKLVNAVLDNLFNSEKI